MLNSNTKARFKKTLYILQQFKSKKRNYIKSEILKYEPYYEVKILNNSALSDIDHWHQLYRNVQNKSFELNTFDLPRKFFNNINLHPNSDIVGLFIKPDYLSDKKSRLVSITFNFRTALNNYAGLVMGLDYHYMNSFNVYKQTLYQSILRASGLNTNRMFLGLTAAETKTKLGALSSQQVAYIQIKDSYNVALIDTMSNQTSNLTDPKTLVLV
mgnify:CR=1 FL=1